MRKKIFIQALLILSIIFIFLFVYLNYFKKADKVDILQVEERNIDQKNSLINITYESIDALGRKYVINAESGNFDEQKPDLIFMDDVKARIILLDGSIIHINSLYAEYNTVNYDTKFQKDIKLNFLEHNIFCNNLNIFFKDNLLEAYNDLTYKNQEIVMLADKMEINLLTKNLKIFNFNDGKVEIKKRNLNGDN
tara:strand:+ start:1586 stop:2167 length:582 start_codon:yes stop_codon:yes gene_type:complete